MAIAQRRLLPGRNRAATSNLLTVLHAYKPDSPYRPFMPPLSGTLDEVGYLADHLDQLENPAPPADPKAVARLSQP